MKKSVHDKRRKNSRKQPKIQEFLSRTSVCVAAALICFIVSILLANFMIQLFNNFMSYVSGLNASDFQNKTFEIPNLFFFDFNRNKWFYLISALTALLVSIKLAYKIKVNFATLAKDQKGSRSWAEISELKEEYRSIPEKDNFYDGRPGFPVSRCKDKIFIDDSPVNNLIIGTTRSGKGELFVFPAIDVYSRPKKQEDRASLILSDPKGELAAASRETLLKRGYNVEVFDIDKFSGMSYNPLEIIKDIYLQGDLPAAQMLTNTLSHILFNDPTAKDKVWQNWSIALCNALILSVVIDCCEEAKYCDTEEEKTEWYNKINMYSAVRLLTDYSQTDEEGLCELDKFFSSRNDGDLAKIQYSSVMTAPGITRGSIFASTLATLVKFTATNIAKMGVKNTLDLKSIGFDKEKPTAVFMVIPDNDSSCHFLVTMFISQLYYILVREGKKKGNGGKCKREVIFLLDEFGNITPIPDLKNTLNVCLGRNIRFDLIIQAYSQIDNLYGHDNAKSIIGACANQIYLLTIELDTAKRFSELIGNETIIVRSRSGDPLSLDKSFTEHVESKPLLNPNELMELLPGENIVCRVTKRNNLNGEKITPNPIYNNNKTIMKYRYEYLSNDFDNSKSFGDLDLEQKCIHNNVRLSNFIYRPIGLKDDNNSEEPKMSVLVDGEIMQEIILKLGNYFNIDEKDALNMSVTEVDEKLQLLIEEEKLSFYEYNLIYEAAEKGVNANAENKV